MAAEREVKQCHPSRVTDTAVPSHGCYWRPRETHNSCLLMTLTRGHWVISDGPLGGSDLTFSSSPLPLPLQVNLKKKSQFDQGSSIPWGKMVLADERPGESERISDL